MAVLRASSPHYPSLPCKGALLAIGCEEPSLEQLPEALRAKLSERHARLFKDQNHWFLIDLNQPPRCQVNGQIIGSDPVRLNAGDVIRFSEELEYSFDPSGSENEPTFEVMLWPQGDIKALPPLKISQFPFLIGKQQAAFSLLADREPERYRFLSRRHAQLFSQAGSLHIEDLGSTNGTWLNGDRQRGSVRKVSEGDHLAFGHRDLVFKVEIIALAQNKDQGPNSADSDLPQGTILVSRAESFLDIYCESGPGSSTSGAADASSGPTSDAISGPESSSPSPAQLIARLAPSQRKWILSGFGVALLLLIALIGSLQEGPDERIEALMAKDKAIEALSLARTYATANPEDDHARELLLQAWQQVTVPAWIARLTQSQWSEARAELEATVEESGLPSGTETRVLLLWLTDLRESRTVLQREPEASVQLYQDESQLASLLNHPAASSIGPGQYNPTLSALIERFPAIAEIRTQALSDLRHLRSLNATLLPAINELKQDVQNHLRNQQLDQLEQTLSRFTRDYPEVIGIAELQADLDQYRQLLAVLASHDLSAYQRLQGELAFLTPPFQESANERVAASNHLWPSAEAYQNAVKAWQAGQVEEALGILEMIPESPWQASAIRQQGEWQSKWDAYIRLQSQPRAPDYLSQLSHLYQRLDADEDQWLRRRLTDELEGSEALASELAQAHLDKASRHWQDYENRSGIDSTLRLESRVSSTFRQRASGLRQAASELAQAQRLQFFLSEEQRRAVTELDQTLTREVTRQRQALASLRGVIDVPVVDAKLALLPSMGN